MYAEVFADAWVLRYCAALLLSPLRVAVKNPLLTLEMAKTFRTSEVLAL